ncbi:MAG: hypothetical protein A2W93_04835 [Bacteroidetes bacterium GWF2_43_63]|nr:MAG: hypothetical protein A2W94_12825 [Bacteroidetes bacterium GWE2_42_42]OFY56080.1 MAG: hypothetical protein A2W93_04835 [Bacteroidetes bacterium GWF2_43_63]HBG70666.1 hypothetical protein [Bacteroidales bacterium]HCB62506.1 hypothetical protein [Bacteroidales bacterium]HCY21961.1 hypothetical protein [Bacteroidales bacterium]
MGPACRKQAGFFMPEAQRRLFQIVFSNKNNIPPSESDAGAEGHGTVVFAIVTTVPCSGINVNS